MSNESDALKQALSFVTGKKFSNTLPPLKPPNPQNAQSDQEIIDDPPEATYYNSYEGSILYPPDPQNGKKYYHGEMLPTGHRANCPILTDDEWAAKYERFPKKERVWNAKRKCLENKTTYPPVTLGAVDKYFMDILNQHDRAIILAFRAAHKSVNVQRKTKRMILDCHLTVVYYGDTFDHADSFSASLRREMTYNANILRDYGYVLDDDQTNRTNKMFFVWQKNDAVRDPGLTVGSMDGTGQMGGHPDVIVLDDVINEKSKNSTARLDGAKDWFTRQVEPMAKDNTYIWIVGTIKDSKDLYYELEQTRMWYVEKLKGIMEWPNQNQQIPGESHNLKNQWYYTYFQSPHDKEPMIRGVAGLIGGKVSFLEYNNNQWSWEGRTQYYQNDDQAKGLDKNRMAMQEFLLRRQAIGIEAFESEFQMNVVKLTGNMLNFDNIRLFNINDPSLGYLEELKLNCVAFYDQALGHSNEADYNCVSVVANYLDEYYILDLFVWKNTGNGVLGKQLVLDGILQLYPYISLLAIEADMAQTSDAEMLVRYFEQKGVNVKGLYQNRFDTSEDKDSSSKVVLDFDGIKVKASKKGKIQRIYNQWQGRLLSNRIFMREGISQEAMNEFNNERSFPLCDHFDVLDATGSAMDQSDKGSSQIHFFGE
ncbi:MAG: hypothetical protein WC651_05050 [Candidatus Gracilibacteria bacterium]|jgi:hypothetical protein